MPDIFARADTLWEEEKRLWEEAEGLWKEQEEARAKVEQLICEGKSCSKEARIAISLARDARAREVKAWETDTAAYIEELAALRGISGE